MAVSRGEGSLVTGLKRILQCGFLGLCVMASITLPTDVSAAESIEQLPTGLLERAQILISNGRYGQAFEYLEPYEAVGAGDVNYNYLYGIAALDSGHPSEAVFALQRVLVVNPDYSAARMELARAYFELGDLEAAENEFEALKEQSPPPLARTAIINYMGAIRRKSSKYKAGLGYYFQAGAGYDSNANGATDVDNFLSFRLDEKNVAKSSSYFDIAYGGNYHFPINAWNQAVFYLGARHRRQPSAEFVDLDRVNGGAALRYKDHKLDVTTALVWSYSELNADSVWDGSYNNSDVGLEFNLAKQLTNQYWRFLGNFRIAKVEYRNAISVQDVDQVLLSLGYGWSESAGDFKQLAGLLILGNESARESGSPYGRQQVGIRWNGSRKLRNSWWLLAQGGFVLSKFDGNFFGQSREDSLINAMVALDWRPFVDPRWSVQPHISYSKNQSDFTIFEYDRTEIGLTLKWATK